MLLGMACSAFGQDRASATDSLPPAWFFGAFGAFGPGSEFTDLVVPPFCGTFRSGSSLGWEGGGLFELPIAPRLALQFRASVAREIGELREPVPGPNPVPLDDGTIIDAQVDQVLAFERTTVGLGAMLRLAPVGRVRMQGGVMIAREIAGEQSQKQVALVPEELLFANGERELELERGTIFSPAALVAGITVGIGYDLPVSRTSTLTPEITLSLPITSRTGAGAWRPLTLRCGGALRFGVVPSLPAIPPDTAPPVVEPPLLVAAVSTRPRTVSVRITEYDSLEVLPLLNQMFFAEGSAGLREPYRQLTMEEADSFTNARLLGSALDVYYHILNIVGRRMREYPEATLAINGYRNGREDEPVLARRRAESIRRYLTDVWGIAGRRLQVAWRGLPPNPARETSAEGFEENARVELIPSDPNILAPVFRRHLQRVATPPAITFFLRPTAEAGVKQWELAMNDETGERWRTFSGTGTPPDSIVWNWHSDSDALPTLPMQLGYIFSVTDSTGAVSASEPTMIDVSYQTVQQKLEHRVNDTTIENFSILLFNYDSPRVSQSDNELLRAIAAGVHSGAIARFTGYTDSLGDVRHNRELAGARAREAAAIFRNLVPSDVTVIIDDTGGEWERFPSTTPEGRSHSRTVMIEIRTPGKEGS